MAGSSAGDALAGALLAADQARVEVREVEGSPGSYSAVAHLRPWLQFEELTTSMRLVASIPKAS